jgi:uncharacterized protein YutE (UPF0331/DUF86 family)
VTIEPLPDVLRTRVSGLAAVYVFGSAETGGAHAASDLDLAMHLVRIERLGVPQESRDAFGLLAGGGLVDADLAERLQKMVGFGNIAVHDYERLNLQIVRSIVTERLHDFERFCERALQRL